MLFVLLTLLQLQSALTEAPTCSILFCGDGDSCADRFAEVWRGAAQEEATRHLLTLNGGWLPPDCAKARNSKLVPPFDIQQQHVLCLYAADLPDETCANKKCNFESHQELFESDDCVDKPANSHHGRKRDEHAGACRTVSSWTKIAHNKLVAGLDELEQQNFDRASSLFCVADFLFGFVNHWLLRTEFNADLPFINEQGRREQRIEHINSRRRQATFEMPAVDVSIRAVQYTLSCSPRREPAPALTTPLASIGQVVDLGVADPLGGVSVVTFFTPTDATDDATVQVTSAFGGTAATFEGTFDVGTVTAVFPCSDQNNLDSGLPSFDIDLRFSGLANVDFAAVQFDGPARPVTSFLPSSACPTAVLINDPAGSEETDEVISNFFAPLSASPAAMQPDEFSSFVESTIGVRMLAEDGCTATDAALMWVDVFAIPGDEAGESEVAGQLQRPRPGIPLTLEPGASICVGGTNAGAACTMISECGAGHACRRKPFAPHDTAYCYDGAVWDERQLCAFADGDEECPFGECVGAVNDLDGGAYPFLWFFKQNDCAGVTSDVCADDRVQHWQQHANPLAFDE